MQGGPHPEGAYQAGDMHWEGHDVCLLLQRAQRSAAWHASAHRALVAGREARVQALEIQVQDLLQEVKAYRTGFAGLQSSAPPDPSPAAPPVRNLHEYQ